LLVPIGLPQPQVLTKEENYGDDDRQDSTEQRALKYFA